MGEWYWNYLIIELNLKFFKITFIKCFKDIENNILTNLNREWNDIEKIIFEKLK